MHKFFVYRREEIDEHYRQRAQVESTFGSIKQKFGETLASKNFTAQLNEIICVGIAHNITVLIRQMFESGILPDFLPPPQHAEVQGQSNTVNPVQPLEPTGSLAS
jgi:hypothetical protein